MYSVKKYNKNYFDLWNTFVETSKNGTFLFHRNFMEYHKDRFDDYSLMIYKGEKLIALLPANKKNTEVFSHQGLTYGGLLLPCSLGVAKVENLFLTVLQFLKQEGFKKIHLKSIPLFYHKVPCNELDPLFFNLKGILTKREQNFAIDYSLPISYHKTKLKHYKKSHDIGFKIVETSNFKSFWTEVLEPRLNEKHQVKPVHTLKEITYLNKHFSNNIVQYNILIKDEILAGITLFKTDNVIKSQYGATTKQGEAYRALDYLFIHLIEKFKVENYRYFDMGIISGNYSLLKQKEELGCHQYLQDFYKIPIL